MGANLCSFRHPSTSHDQGVNNPGNDTSSKSCSAILGLIRLTAGCLQKTDDHQRAEKRSTTSNALVMHTSDDQKKIKKSKVMRKLTLEEWIMNSPASHVRKPNFHSGGELYVFRHSSKKVHPSAYSSSSRSSPFDRRTSLASKAKDSFCLEPVVMKSAGREGHGHGASSTNSMSRSVSGKLTKRVSFREEPDIFIFYSPDEEALFSDRQNSVV